LGNDLMLIRRGNHEFSQKEILLCKLITLHVFLKIVINPYLHIIDDHSMTAEITRQFT
jgi:hypothetical protein